MNTKKIFGYGTQNLLCAFAVVLALAFTACGDGSDGDDGTGHTHTYSTTWSYDATQHWHECTANDGAKTSTANHTDDPCTVCGYGNSATPVTFSSLTADGDATATTTTLTLTFSAAITGLSANDITLSGVAGVSKGTLGGSGPTYTLPISGFTAGGALSVAVSKTGYDISGSPKTVPIYYYTSGGGGGDDMTWTAVEDSTFPSTIIRDIAYGNDRWVAVGDDGGMVYSTDNGESWTAVTNSRFGSDSINGIAYGDNRFVAVAGRTSSGNNNFAYSTDGESWTAVSNKIFDWPLRINAIAYGDNRFVAVGTHGKMAYSTDNGENWTAVEDSTFGTSNNTIYAIAYGNNKFVAVGDFGKMAYSTDGENWTAIRSLDNPWNSTLPRAIIRDIAYGNNRFVAVGHTGGMAYSTDGESWTAVATANITSIWGYTYQNQSWTANIYGIAYGNNRFVAVGEGGRMAYSADNGVTWTAVENSRFGSDSINAIAYGNNRFVAVGWSRKIAYADW